MCVHQRWSFHQQTKRSSFLLALHAQPQHSCWSSHMHIPGSLSQPHSLPWHSSSWANYEVGTPIISRSMTNGPIFRKSPFTETRVACVAGKADACCQDLHVTLLASFPKGETPHHCRLGISPPISSESCNLQENGCCKSGAAGCCIVCFCATLVGMLN